MNYVVSAIDVYRNGVKMAPADFTATNGTSIVLANGCTVGDTVEVISYPMITYTDAVKRTGDTMTGTLALPSGGLNVGSGQLSVDASGRVLSPSQPSFKTTYASGKTGPANTWAKLPNFDSIITNVGNGYNSSTGRFTAPVAGTYVFMVGGILGTASTNHDRFAICLAKNGTLSGPCGGGQFSAGDTPVAQSCFIHTANASDYFEVHMFSPIAFSLNFGDPYGFYFSGYLLG
jgi:hypothetical protein